MKIYLFGASTETDNYPTFSDFPWQGWGYRLKDYFDDSVEIINLSLAGWSLKALTSVSYAPFTELIQQYPENYKDESKSVWAYLMSKVGNGDYVVMGGTSVNARFREDMGWQESVEEYKELLTSCCKKLMEKGAKPIIVTDAPSMRIYEHIKKYEEAKFEVFNEFDGKIQVLDIAKEFYSIFETGKYSKDEFITKYFRTKATIEHYYSRYGFIGNKLCRYFGNNPENFKVDEVHMCIEGALTQSSIFVRLAKENIAGLSDRIVRTKLDMDRCIREDLVSVADNVSINFE